jgi:hypothetical protein
MAAYFLKAPGTSLHPCYLLLLQVDVNEGADLPLLLPREQTPWTSQFATLFRRSFKEQWRRRAMFITQIIQTIMMAAMVGMCLLHPAHLHQVLQLKVDGVWWFG